MNIACVSVMNIEPWVIWAKKHNCKRPGSGASIIGMLRILDPIVGKKQAAALTHLGLYFDHFKEIPNVGLVCLDRAPQTDVKLYLGQASVLHWIQLDDPEINKHLRSVGILGWWESK